MPMWLRALLFPFLWAVAAVPGYYFSLAVIESRSPEHAAATFTLIFGGMFAGAIGAGMVKNG